MTLTHCIRWIRETKLYRRLLRANWWLSPWTWTVNSRTFWPTSLVSTVACPYRQSNVPCCYAAVCKNRFLAQNTIHWNQMTRKDQFWSACFHVKDVGMLFLPVSKATSQTILPGFYSSSILDVMFLHLLHVTCPFFLRRGSEILQFWHFLIELGGCTVGTVSVVMCYCLNLSNR